MKIIQVYPHFVNLEAFLNSKNKYNYYAEKLADEGHEVEQLILGDKNAVIYNNGYTVKMFPGKRLRLIHGYSWSPQLFKYISKNEKAILHTHNVIFINHFVARAYKGEQFFISNLGELTRFRNPMFSLIKSQLNRGKSIFTSKSDERLATEIYDCYNTGIVRNSIDPNIFKKRRGKRKGLLFVGRNHPDKAIDLLLEYSGKTPLHVVGEGFNNKISWWDDDHGTPYLSAGTDNITYGRIVTPNRLCELYNESKLLLLPSVKEGMPTVILEAAACGTPVFGCSDCKGTVETIEEIGAGYSSKRSSYFESLEYLLMGKIPRVKLSKEFTHEETYKQLKKIYFGDI